MGSIPVRNDMVVEKMHNKLHALYSSPKSIRMISLMKTRGTTDVTRTPYIYIYIKALFYAYFVYVYFNATLPVYISQFTPSRFRFITIWLVYFHSIFYFLRRFLFTSAFSRTPLWRKIRPWCTMFWRTACRNHLISDLGVDGAVILKFTVKGTGRNGWSGFIWFTTQATWEFLWTL